MWLCSVGVDAVCKTHLVDGDPVLDSISESFETQTGKARKVWHDLVAIVKSTVPVFEGKGIVPVEDGDERGQALHQAFVNLLGFRGVCQG